MTAWVSDPDATLRWAAEVLTAARADPATRARAWHAAAVAHLERGEPVPARRAARRALASAGPEAHLVLAWIELDAGDPRASLRHLNLAQPGLRGPLLVRARCLRGLNLCVTGEYDRAHGELSAAIRGARRHGAAHWLANALNGRGVVRTYLRRLAAAERDLAAAAELYAALGERERAATCVHNLGCVALQAQDVPRALRLFDEAVTRGLRVDARGEALIDRAHALLAAGLVAEAGEILGAAAELLGGAGRSMRLAEAWLALARCGRDPAAARRAAGLFRAPRGAGWLAAAEAVELGLTPSPPERTTRLLARRCARLGFAVEAAELRLAAGHRDLLRLVQTNRSSGHPRLSALGWLARARLAVLDGDRRAVFAACRAGLRTGSDPGAFRDVAVATALEAGDPVEVLRWAGDTPVRELTASLGGTALLVYLEHAGGLSILSVVDGRVRLHPTGPPVRPDGSGGLRWAADVRALRFLLGAGERATTVAGRLDDLLLGPVRPVVGDRPLVVVPAAGLRGLPWAALPGCAGRPVSVAPSVSAWLAASRTPSTVEDALWVAGPGLRHAEREVTALHRRYGGTLLTGGAATVDKLRAVGAGLVHIAAHGRYRAQAPLYSYLELADGPLFGHELGAASILVLSACESALAVPLRPGTRAMIASTVPVADHAAEGLVLALHEELHRGRSPAEALAAAQTRHGDRAFVCVGAG